MIEKAGFPLSIHLAACPFPLAKALCVMYNDEKPALLTVSSISAAG